MQWKNELCVLPESVDIAFQPKDLQENALEYNANNFSYVRWHTLTTRVEIRATTAKMRIERKTGYKTTMRPPASHQMWGADKRSPVENEEPQFHPP